MPSKLKIVEWAKREDKKESFGIDLFDVRQINQAESDDDGNRIIKTRVSAKGRFRQQLLSNKITLEPSKLKLKEIPISVDLLLSRSRLAQAKRGHSALCFSFQP